MTNRVLKINTLIKQIVSDIIARKLHLKSNVFLTISRVYTTNDLYQSTVFVSVFPASEARYAIKTLEHEQGLIKKTLSQKLNLRKMPKISFVYDDTEERADKIEKIFHDLNL